MERSKQRGSVALDVGRDGTAVVVDEVHNQEIVCGEMDMGNRQTGQALELREHVTFEFETRPVAAHARLDHETAPVLEARDEAREAKADAQRRRLHDGRTKRRLQACLKFAVAHGTPLTLRGIRLVLWRQALPFVGRPS